jgi:hypothetical protein
LTRIRYLTWSGKKDKFENGTAQNDCCLEKDTDLENNFISFYQFFRDARLKENGSNKTKIDVEVCGLKNFIVQNDESVMDVNAPVYPWGARPNVIDFNISAAKIYTVTNDFVTNPGLNGIDINTRNFLNALIAASPSHVHVVGTTLADVEAFLLTLPAATPPGDIIALRNLFTKQNLSGPNFYIGSQEIFCKKWNEVYINLNWKDKPSNFNEYYKAYWVDPTDMTRFGLYEEKFEVNIALLEEMEWKKEKVYTIPNPPTANGAFVNPVTHDANRKLFHSDGVAAFCTHPDAYDQTIRVAKEYISGIDPQFRITPEKLVKYDVNTANGFLRINLQNQDFLHKDYAFVLARQMMALGKLPKDHVEGAVYYDKVSPGTGPIVISTTEVLNSLIGSAWIAREINEDVTTIKTNTPGAGSIPNPPNANNIRNALNVPSYS